MCIRDSQDPLQREYYLSKLPTTPEQIAASDEIIQTALVGMGKAFNEQMERFEEAVKSYEDLLRRYPEYADRASIYYTCLLYTSRCVEETGCSHTKRCFSPQIRTLVGSMRKCSAW